MVYYQAIFTLSFMLLYLFYFLFLPRMPGNSLLVEVSQYWKKKKYTLYYVHSNNSDYNIIVYNIIVNYIIATYFCYVI